MNAFFLYLLIYRKQIRIRREAVHGKVVEP